MKFVIALAAGSMLAAFPITRAAEINEDDNAVIVTATRTAQTINESMAAVTVITRQDIERAQSQDLYDLLRLQSGIDMNRNGGPGSFTSLFMRGTNSNHTLVLIDGVRAAETTTGGFAWQHMSLSQIERIEIVRGPRTSLYGSDAIGGVIQIFTRKPKGATARLEAGSYQTRGLDIGWGTSGDIRFTVDASLRKSEGFSAQNEDGFSFDPDRDGSDTKSITAGIQLPLPMKQVFKLNTWLSKDEVEYDVGINNSVNQTIDARIEGQLDDIWSHIFKIGYALDELEDESLFSSEITTKRYMADWQNDLILSKDAIFTTGISYVRDNGKNIDTIANTEVFNRSSTNKAIFQNLQFAAFNNDFQIGARYDDYNNIDNKSTGNIAWARNILAGTRLWMSYGTAFHAPTLNQLYHPGFGGFFAGNPDLKPETAKTAEVGLKLKPSPEQSLEFVLFATKVDELIAYEGINQQAININKASIEGLELTHTINQGHWHYQTNITMQKARNDSDASELLRRPDQKVSFALDRGIGRGNIGGELLLVSDSADIATRLPGYGVTNLRFRLPIMRRLTLDARIDNVFNKFYETAEGFNTPDRSFFASLRYSH